MGKRYGPGKFPHWETFFQFDGLPFKILTGFILLSAAFDFPILVKRVLFPFQVGQGEAINVDFALTLLRGGALYHDSSQGPFLYPAYPPLYPWLQNLLLEFVRNVWFPGRFLAFLGYLGCGLLLFLWGRRRWGVTLALLLSGLFWLFPTWALWGTMDRCDALFLGVYFSAFLLLYREELLNSTIVKGKEWPGAGVAWAGLLSALSILIKQNGFELWAVYGFFCLFGGRWKRILFFLLFSAPWVAVTFWVEQRQSGGAFLKSTFLWLNTGIDWANFWHYISGPFPREGGALFVLVALLLWKKKINNLLRWQLLFSALSIFSLTRAMSAENYFMEFYLFGIFLAGEAAASGRIGGHGKKRPKKIAALSAWYFLVFAIQFASLSWMKWPTLPDPEVIDMKRELVDEIYAGPGEHLALDLDLPIMAGKKIWLQPAEYTAMVEKGTWSEAPLIAEIKDKKFSTIELYDIPRQYLLPEDIQAEILKNYRVNLRKYGRLWLVPKSVENTAHGNVGVK